MVLTPVCLWYVCICVMYTNVHKPFSHSDTNREIGRRRQQRTHASRPAGRSGVVASASIASQRLSSKLLFSQPTAFCLVYQILQSNYVLFRVGLRWEPEPVSLRLVTQQAIRRAHGFSKETYVVRSWN
jgi:hypothetical protein